MSCRVFFLPSPNCFCYPPTGTGRNLVATKGLSGVDFNSFCQVFKLASSDADDAGCRASVDPSLMKLMLALTGSRD